MINRGIRTKFVSYANVRSMQGVQDERVFDYWLTDQRSEPVMFHNEPKEGRGFPDLAGKDGDEWSGMGRDEQIDNECFALCEREPNEGRVGWSKDNLAYRDYQFG